MSRAIKIQSEVFLREDINKIIKALLLAADVLPAGPYKDGYARGLQVVWQAICADANEPRVQAPTTPYEGLTGWENVDSGVFSCGGF